MMMLPMLVWAFQKGMMVPVGFPRAIFYSCAAVHSWCKSDEHSRPRAVFYLGRIFVKQSL